jgi:serine/threonine protein kinase/tetratricopeptide (TPR) repeat protein
MDDLAIRLQASLGTAYTIERELGRGGMATVFLARDLKHKRSVAIKVLDPELAESLGAPRFLREVELAARLTHPHIVALHDSGDADGLLYYVMPFLAGETLRARLDRDGALPLDVTAQLVSEAAGALDYAHREGIVHRDVKPENVLLHEKHALLADFGVARAVSRATEGAAREVLTQTGFAVGTPAYMSPEQAVGERELTAASDIYSLGCVTYEMLTGRAPFAGSSAEQVAKRLTSTPPAPSSVRDGLPAGVDGVVARALALNPNERYATAGEFAAELGASVRSADRQVKASRHETGSHKLRWLAVAAAVLVAVAAGGVWMMTRREMGAPSQGDGSNGRTMVAVLPFKNLGRPDDEYFADGVTEEITSRLASLPGLGVISRTSADQYKGTTKPLKQIARELGVAYVLEGSVRWDRPTGTQSPGRVRVTPQLIRVSDDSHVWSDRLDDDAVDVFVVQGRVAEEVANALGVALGSGERATLAEKPTANFEAYNAYLRGLDAEKRQDVESKREAIRLFEQATRLDPTFALAYVRLARVHVSHAGDATQSQKAIEAALRLKPDMPEARVVSAMLHLFRSDYDRAEQELAAAKKRGPNRNDVAEMEGFLSMLLGRWESALQSYARAVALDPRSADANWGIIHVFHHLRRYPEASRYLERLRAVTPDDPGVYLFEAHLHATLGENHGKALSLLREAERRLGLRRLVGGVLATTSPIAEILNVFAPDQLAVIDTMTMVPEDFGRDTANYYIMREALHFVQRRRDLVRVYNDSIRLVGEKRNDHTLKAAAYAELGRKGDAMRELEEAAKEVSATARPFLALNFMLLSARIQATAGEEEKAIDNLEHLLSVPSLVSVGALRFERSWDPLRDNPRFQRLLVRKQ